MEIVKNPIKTGTVGGISANAASGSGYNQGNQFAAQGGYHGGVGSHKDVRGGNAASASGYNQGNQFAAEGGVSGSQGVPGASHKDLRGGNSNSGSGYNQGNQFAASKK